MLLQGRGGFVARYVQPLDFRRELRALGIKRADGRFGGGQRFDKPPAFLNPLRHGLPLFSQPMQLPIVRAPAVGLIGGNLLLLAQSVAPLNQMRNRALPFWSGEGFQLGVQARQGRGRRRGGSRARSQQLRSRIGAVPQALQLVAVEGEHSVEGVFVDILHQLNRAGDGRIFSLAGQCPAVGEQQRARSVAIFRSVIVACKRSFAPPEEDAPHQRGKRRLPRLVCTEHHVELRSEGADCVIMKGPEVAETQIFQENTGAAHRSSPP